MSPTPARRYSAVAHKLETLPTELVHKILDDLPLLKILEVICIHDVSYVDTCVLSHIHLREIFPTPEYLSILKQYFTLYVELCRRRQSRHTNGNPDIAFLARDALYFVEQHKKPGSYGKMLATVKAEILPLLEMYEPYLPTLSNFAPEPVVGRVPELSDPTALWDFWINLEAAERNLNSTKSSQLQRIAKLYLEYPGTLRKCSDTSQEPRRHSQQHRVEAMEGLASRILKPQILRGKFVGKAIFSEQRFPVVPYDRHLNCFLRVLDKFPLGGVSIPSDSGRRRTPKVYAWPPALAEDIKKVVEGMAYIYPKTLDGENYPPILRTKHNRYSHIDYRPSKGGNQPRFLGGPGDEKGQEKQLRILADNDILPLAEKEFEWLEAFLKSCRYMEGMDDAEWKSGMTVKQFWKIHTSDVSSLTQKSTTQGHPI